ncbi:MAG: class I SAM-dependent rRNA methyltransferase [Ardenticatenaceae bacterium]|nr:class I SAM-dependent rRNA methyltransferase [Ardenticatenaceae bacterium]MCB8989478.1 class I SAM-dependent rRNA methyltransferase [Ardenticatenaceae bacterium]
METTTLVLKPGREKPVLNRHPWVFSGAIARVSGSPTPGDVVEVVDVDGRSLAHAYYNPHSQIRARILTWDEHTPIDDAFWRQQIQRAINGRQQLNLEPVTNAYRLIHAEADGLPGFIVDKYGDYLVMQCLTLGIDRRKEALAAILADLLHPRGILERSDADVRQKEGLPQQTGLLWGSAPPDEVQILENGHRFGVNLHEGHKTGFYLDQRDNRALLGQPHFVSGKEILNVFAYTGGFAIYAAAHDAGPIINLDTSVPALTQAERNIELNGYSRPDDVYLLGDAFQVLRDYRDNGRQFDIIILDPPKFAHSQRDVQRATRGYKDLNWLALRLLPPGGILATFSCSGLISADLFQKVVFGAAVDAHREVQILHTLSQGPDHPILLTFPESAYLKGLLCRVW